LVGDTIIVDNGREPSSIPSYHPPIQGDEVDEPVDTGPNTGPDAGSDARPDARPDAGLDARPLENGRNASKKRGKSDAQLSRFSSRLRGQNPTEKGISNSEGFDATITVTKEAKKTGNEDIERFVLLATLYSTANQEPAIPQNIAEATSRPDKKKWL